MLVDTTKRYENTCFYLVSKLPYQKNMGKTYALVRLSDAKEVISLCFWFNGLNIFLSEEIYMICQCLLYHIASKLLRLLFI